MIKFTQISVSVSQDEFIAADLNFVLLTILTNTQVIIFLSGGRKKQLPPSLCFEDHLGNSGVTLLGPFLFELIRSFSNEITRVVLAT